MKKIWKEYSILVFAFAAVAWLLPQSLFYDCVRPQMERGTEMYSEEAYQKLFDVSEDEFEIVFWFGRED